MVNLRENGNYCYQVKDLIKELKDFNPDALVLIIGSEQDGTSFEKPFYKIAETADETEIYLYSGDKRDAPQ